MSNTLQDFHPDDKVVITKSEDRPELINKVGVIRYIAGPLQTDHHIRVQVEDKAIWCNPDQLARVMPWIWPIKLVRVQHGEHDHTHLLMSDGTSSHLHNKWLGRPDETEVPCRDWREDDA